MKQSETYNVLDWTSRGRSVRGWKTGPRGDRPLTDEERVVCDRKSILINNEKNPDLVYRRLQKVRPAKQVRKEFEERKRRKYVQ